MLEKRKVLGNFKKILIIFWLKIYRKFECLFILFLFWKIVTKTRAFGNNTIFLSHFFRFRGGGFSLSPIATLLETIVPPSKFEIIRGVARILGRGMNILGGRHLGGPGAERHGRPRIFENYLTFLKNKNALQNNFKTLDEKHKLLGNVKEILKILNEDSKYNTF